MAQYSQVATDTPSRLRTKLQRLGSGGSRSRSKCYNTEYSLERETASTYFDTPSFEGPVRRRKQLKTADSKHGESTGENTLWQSSASGVDHTIFSPSEQEFNRISTLSTSPSSSEMESDYDLESPWNPKTPSPTQHILSLLPSVIAEDDCKNDDTHDEAVYNSVQNGTDLVYIPLNPRFSVDSILRQRQSRLFGKEERSLHAQVHDLELQYMNLKEQQHRIVFEGSFPSF